MRSPAREAAAFLLQTWGWGKLPRGLTLQEKLPVEEVLGVCPGLWREALAKHGIPGFPRLRGFSLGGHDVYDSQLEAEGAPRIHPAKIALSPSPPAPVAQRPAGPGRSGDSTDPWG